MPATLSHTVSCEVAHEPVVRRAEWAVVSAVVESAHTTVTNLLHELRFGTRRGQQLEQSRGMPAFSVAHCGGFGLSPAP